MIKFGALAIIGFILVILGSCQLIRCACGGGPSGYVFVCPKPGCPGKVVVQNKKNVPSCIPEHGTMIPEADKKTK